MRYSGPCNPAYDGYRPRRLLAGARGMTSFQFMMNKLVQKSDNPLAYPENSLTDMVTNFGAEILFIAMLALTPVAGNMFVVFAAFFGIGETIARAVQLDRPHAAPRGRARREPGRPPAGGAADLLHLRQPGLSGDRAVDQLRAGERHHVRRPGAGCGGRQANFRITPDRVTLQKVEPLAL